MRAVRTAVSTLCLVLTGSVPTTLQCSAHFDQNDRGIIIISSSWFHIYSTLCKIAVLTKFSGIFGSHIYILCVLVNWEMQNWKVLDKTDKKIVLSSSYWPWTVSVNFHDLSFTRCRLVTMISVHCRFCTSDHISGRIQQSVCYVYVLFVSLGTITLEQNNF